MKILAIVPSLGYSSAAREASLLGQRLAKRVEFHACALAGAGPWADDLRQAGAMVHDLAWTRPIDPMPLWRLRRLLSDVDPDRIHVWRPAALRAFALVGRRFLQRVRFHQAAPRAGGKPSRIDRWLLARVNTIVAGGPAEADRLASLGIGAQRTVVIPPGVALAAQGDRKKAGHSIVCMGALEKHKGYEEALWAYDVLAFPYRDVHIHLFGAGPHRSRLLSLAASKVYSERIHFEGEERCAECDLAGATACWVPSLAPCGRRTALEALAAGCPVIASDWPELREIVADGETGFLIPPGDKVALARRTRELILDPELQGAMSANACRRARDAFGIENWVASIVGL